MIKLSALLAAALLLAPLGARADNFFAYSDEQLRVLQHNLARSYAGGSYADDSVLEVYLNNLGHKLSPHSRNFIYAELAPESNAFASWGNIISINVGLIDFVQSEAELAGVLAHEDAHISQQHFTRLLKGLSAQSGITIASVLLAFLTDGVTSADIIGGGIALQKNQEYALRRRYEREADRRALNKLLAANYSLDDYLQLLTRLSSGHDIPAYASTHPDAEARIADLKARGRSRRLGGKKTGSPLDFWLIQARARSYVEATHDDKTPREHQGAVHAYSRILDANQPDRQDVETLMSHRANWIAAITLADALLKLNERDAALNIVRAAHAAAPDNEALAEKLLLLHSGDPALLADAKLLLASLPSALRNGRRVANAEAKLWNSTGDQLRYRIALGYALFADGRLAQAKEQIKLAQAHQDGSAAASVTAGRIAILQQQIELFEVLPTNLSI